MKELACYLLELDYFVMLDDKEIHVKPPYEMDFTNNAMQILEVEISAKFGDKYLVRKHSVMSNCYTVCKK